MLFFYFAPSFDLLGTGRRFPNYEKYIENGIYNPNLFDEDIICFLNKCKAYKFKTCVLLNGLLLGMPYNNNDLKSKIPKIQQFLERLDEMCVTDYVCIANPYLLELLNWNRIKNIKIKASVNFQIKSERTIRLLNNLINYWFPSGKLAEVELQKDLLRDIKSIEKIRKSLENPVNLSIIINEGCLNGCPYQIMHQLHSSTMSIDDVKNHQEFKFGVARCKNITATEPWLILDSNWILPRHMERYTGLIDSFKLTDRADSTDTILNKVKAYALKDYDRENINTLISLMQMESWKFPEIVLPPDFDDIIFSGRDVPEEYYASIWNKIKKYNAGRYPNERVAIQIDRLSKDSLFRYEAID